MRETPTLNIKELALLKSAPKEFYTNKLKKDLEERTVKHPINERALYRGSKVEVSVDKNGTTHYAYPDGTDLTVDEYGGIVGLEREGETTGNTKKPSFGASLFETESQLELMSDEFRDWQSSYNPTEEDMELANSYQTIRVKYKDLIAQYHRGEISKEDFLKEYNRQEKASFESIGFGDYEGITAKDYDDAEAAFNRLAWNTQISQVNEYMTVQRQDLTENDLKRRIVADPTYNEAYVSTRGIKDKDGYTQSYLQEGDWQIITKYPEGDKQGRGIPNVMVSDYVEDHSTDTIINRKYQKFETEIIDEEHKVLIRHAYDPEYNDGNPYTD